MGEVKIVPRLQRLQPSPHVLNRNGVCLSQCPLWPPHWPPSWGVWVRASWGLRWEAKEYSNLAVHLSWLLCPKTVTVKARRHFYHEMSDRYFVCELCGMYICEHVYDYIYGVCVCARERER